MKTFLSKISLWLKPYNYDKRNPYRRYCRACGSTQDMVIYWSGARRWENMGLNGITCKTCGRKANENEFS